MSEADESELETRRRERGYSAVRGLMYLAAEIRCEIPLQVPSNSDLSANAVLSQLTLHAINTVWEFTNRSIFRFTSTAVIHDFDMSHNVQLYIHLSTYSTAASSVAFNGYFFFEAFFAFLACFWLSILTALISPPLSALFCSAFLCPSSSLSRLHRLCLNHCFRVLNLLVLRPVVLASFPIAQLSSR